MKFETIYDRENAIFRDIMNMSTPEERELFVSDGLCWADIKCGEKLPQDTYIEMEGIYLCSSPRIVFLCKEPNNASGEDYRDWHWSESTSNILFRDSIALWLKGLLSISNDNSPILQAIKENRYIFSSIPVTIMNVKKYSGGNKSDWSVIFNHAERFARQLREQLDLYSPDIIVCCGSSDNEKEELNNKMIKIAKRYLYPDLSFDKINNFCHYCIDKQLLLIDSYHPSYNVCNEWKFDKMFEYYYEFRKEYSFLE